MASYYASFFLILKKHLHPTISLLWCTSHSKCVKKRKIGCFDFLGFTVQEKQTHRPTLQIRHGRREFKTKNESWENQLKRWISTETVLVELLFLVQPHYFHLQENFKPDIFRKLVVVLKSVLRRLIYHACFKPQNHLTVSIFHQNTHWQSLPIITTMYPKQFVLNKSILN